MELKIHKKYLLRIEHYTRYTMYTIDKHAYRFVFNLPPKAGKDGYTIYIEANYQYDYNQSVEANEEAIKQLSLKNNYYKFNFPTNYFLTATKTENREEEKRYSRYKYTALELECMYNNIDYADVKNVLAKIKIYDISTFPFPNVEVIEEKYVIGKKINCWLFCDECDQKRLVNSKGVQIIGTFDDFNKDNILACIDDFNKDSNNLRATQNIYEAMIDDYNKAISDIATTLRLYDNYLTKDLLKEHTELEELISNQKQKTETYLSNFEEDFKTKSTEKFLGKVKKYLI